MIDQQPVLLGLKHHINLIILPLLFVLCHLGGELRPVHTVSIPTVGNFLPLPGLHLALRRDNFHVELALSARVLLDARVVISELSLASLVEILQVLFLLLLLGLLLGPVLELCFFVGLLRPLCVEFGLAVIGT